MYITNACMNKIFPIYQYVTLDTGKTFSVYFTKLIILSSYFTSLASYTFGK